jgi:hypothetical protein
MRKRRLRLLAFECQHVCQKGFIQLVPATFCAALCRRNTASQDNNERRAFEACASPGRFEANRQRTQEHWAKGGGWKRRSAPESAAHSPKVRSLFTLVGIAGEDDLDAPDLLTPTQRGPGLAPSRDPGRLNGAILNPSPLDVFRARARELRWSDQPRPSATTRFHRRKGGPRGGGHDTREQ